MKAVKWALQSACTLAVACGLAAAGDAVAQARGEPGQAQARKSTRASKDAQASAVARQNRAAQANSSKRARPSPAVAAKNSKAPSLAATRKARPVASSKSAAKKPAVAARSPAKAPVTTRVPTPRPATAIARRPPAPALPPPVAWVPPPLGPERFYPNGIPELRPEFLHPERPPIAQQAVIRAPTPGGEPELLP